MVRRKTDFPSQLMVDIERHNMTLEEFGLLLQEQDFKCGACRRAFLVQSGMLVDHDTDGVVCGVLCRKCFFADWLPFEYTEHPPATRVFMFPKRFRLRVA